jgi:hypothetical protein
VLRDGAPVPVPVVIGASDGRRTEIREGSIQPGESIVVDTASR